MTPIKNRLFYDEKSASVRLPQTKRNGTLRSGTCSFKITTTTRKLAGLGGLTNWYIAKCLFARHCVMNFPAVWGHVRPVLASTEPCASYSSASLLYFEAQHGFQNTSSRRAVVYERL